MDANSSEFPIISYVCPNAHLAPRTGNSRLNVNSGELLVAFGTSEYNIDPYAHRVWTRSHKVIHPVECLDAERQLRSRTLHLVKVVNKHILDRLEVDDATRTRLRLVAVVRQTTFCPVEHKPALLPRPDSAAHLCQVATATDGRHGKVRTLVDRVTGNDDEL